MYNLSWLVILKEFHEKDMMTFKTYVWLLLALNGGLSLANSGQFLSAQEWAWECVPSVVKNNGESFVLTVEIGNGDVDSLSVSVTNGLFAGVGNGTFALRDNGVAPDQLCPSARWNS